jgi:hypothetical protein
MVRLLEQEDVMIVDNGSLIAYGLIHDTSLVI